MSEGEDKKSTKRRSGRTSPGVTLSTSIEHARKVIEKLGAQPASADLVAQALGHSGANNGAAGSKIGAMTHFGLLESTGNSQYGITGLGIAILRPVSNTERADAIARAVKTPALYAEIFRDHAGQAIPMMFANILARRYEVADWKCEEVAKIFRESVEFAGLLRRGILYSEPEGEPQETNSGEVGQRDEALSAPTPSTVGQTPQEPIPPSAVSPPVIPNSALQPDGYQPVATMKVDVGVSFEILLPRRRIARLHLPPAFDEQDLDKLNAWLVFNRDALLLSDE